MPVFFSPDVFAGVEPGVRPSPDTALLNVRTASNFHESSGVNSSLRPRTGAPRFTNSSRGSPSGVFPATFSPPKKFQALITVAPAAGCEANIVASMPVFFPPDVFAGVEPGACPSPDTALLNVRTASNFHESSGVNSLLRPRTGAPRFTNSSRGSPSGVFPATFSPPKKFQALITVAPAAGCETNIVASMPVFLFPERVRRC